MTTGAKIGIGAGVGLAVIVIIVLVAKKSSAKTTSLTQLPINQNQPNANQGQSTMPKPIDPKYLPPDAIIDTAGNVREGAQYIKVGKDIYPIAPPIDNGIGAYNNKPKMG